MFAGFVVQESAFNGVLLVKSEETPVNADAFPTFRVYGPSGYLGVSGTCSFLDTGSITNATNANPVVVTSAGHGLSSGARVTIGGVLGNTAANTTAVVTVIDSNTFSIPVAGNGSYTGGGTWNAAGLYRWSVPATGANGFTAGVVYDVAFNWSVSATAGGDVQALAVV